MGQNKTIGAAIRAGKLWTPGGGDRDGWIVRAAQSNITSAGTVPISKNAYTAANQPQGDKVEVISADAGDTTQSIDIYGVDMNGNRVVERVALTGDTAASTTQKFNYVESARLTAPCAGAVTIREASADQAIGSITIGDLVFYIAHLFTGHLTGYLAYLNCEVTTLTADVAFTLRWYPDDASCVALTAYEEIDSLNVFIDEGINPTPRLYFPVMKVLEPGSYLTVSAVGAGGQNTEDVAVTMMGFWQL